MTIKDFFTVRPEELEPGDTLMCTVKLVVMHHTGPSGAQRFRVYRCEYDPGAAFEEPQGCQIAEADTVGKALFYAVGAAGMEGE